MEFEMGDGDDIMSALRALDPVNAATGNAAKPTFLSQQLGVGGGGGDGVAATVSATPANPSPEELLLGLPPPPVPLGPPEPVTGGGGGGGGGDVVGGGANLDSLYPNMKLSGVLPRIQNVVSMFNLGTALNLKHIALHAKNAEYNPKRFAAAIMRIREPKTTALIFASGKVVVTGAENEDASKRASKKFAKIIVKLGYAAKFKDFKVQNIVGSTGVPFPIRLEMMAAENAHSCSYEPELFPGLIFRMANPKVVLLIFVSGKLVLTGARSRADVYAAFDKIYPVLVKYDKSKKFEKVQ